MATEPASGADTPSPSNRRMLLVAGVVALLAFAAGMGLTLSGWGDRGLALVGMGPLAEEKPEDNDLVAHTKKEWVGRGIATVVPIGRMTINLQSNESDTEPESFLMIALSLKVNLDSTHPNEFPDDAQKLDEFNKRLKNITPQLNQALLEFFRGKTRKTLNGYDILILQEEIWAKIQEVLEEGFYTKLEKAANETDGKEALIADVLFEEFTIQ